MVTLWNDMRLAYGMPPMGFIAPFLYYVQAHSPDAFNDITTGNNVSVLYVVFSVILWRVLHELVR